MCNRLPVDVVAFVRSASKEIVRCLLPEELPYFETIWQAIKPILELPAAHLAEQTDISALLADRSAGHALATKWSRDADLLSPSVFWVLKSTLDDVVEAGTFSEQNIAEFAARHALRWPIPNRFFQMIVVFVTHFCRAMLKPDEEIGGYLLSAQQATPHKRCYVVFNNGADYLYPENLPNSILGLRETVLFWVDRTAKDFRSRGRHRKRLGPQTERVLRFLCSKENAGRTVSFSELYVYVWQKDPPSDEEKMKSSIKVEMSKLNTFADKIFEHMSDPDAWITLHGKQYKIKDGLSGECCIIRVYAVQDRPT